MGKAFHLAVTCYVLDEIWDIIESVSVRGGGVPSYSHRKGSEIRLDHGMFRSFEKLKNLLVNCPILTHPFYLNPLS